MAGISSMEGAPMTCKQSGTAAMTAPRHSAMAVGLPGKVMMRDEPLIPAVWRDKMAVGMRPIDTARIASPNPGSILVQTACVASGVTSRGDGPVPPVVTTNEQFCTSIRSTKVAEMMSSSSGIRQSTNSMGEVMQPVRNWWIAGAPLSSYTPVEARSETETTPMRVVMTSAGVRASARNQGQPYSQNQQP